MELFLKKTARNKFLYALLILVYLYLLSPLPFNYFGSTSYINYENGAANYLFYHSLVIGWLFSTLILGMAIFYVNFNYRNSAVFIALFIVFILVASIIEIDNWRMRQHLKSYGQYNYAVCIEKEVIFDSHIIYYKFEENNKMIYGHENVPLKIFKNYKEGDTVFTVIVSKQNNKIFEVEGRYIGEYEDLE